MRLLLVPFLVILAIGAFVGLQAVYVVDVTEQIIITRFGEIQRKENTAGLYFKTPFIEQVTRFSKKVLRYDAPPRSLITSDKKNLVIDAYARYRIIDVRRVRETVVNALRLDARVGEIVSNQLRNNVASNPQSDIISETRAELMTEVTRAAGVEASELGVKILDVRIKRADFPTEVASSIFARMNAERNAEATKFRAEGSEEELKIKAEAEKEKTILLAEARKQAEILRGEGEAEAIRIYADALEQDPEFFAFTRTLEAYKKFLTTQTTVVLPADSELFRFLSSPAVQEEASSVSGQ